jgi:outer membrane protein insertion porin family
MHAGTKFTADELAAAAQRLVDTGYFDDVTAFLEGRATAMTINFMLKPTPREHMLHVGYQNFIWLTHTEIEAAILTKSPLFLGYLPEGSPIQDTLNAALTEALTAKGVRAAVAYQTVEPTLRHPVREIEFRVTSPEIAVANVKLAGVSQELVPFVQKSVNSTAHKPYLAEPEGLTTADQILTPLFDAGYIQATLSDVSVTPSATPTGGIGIVVAATLNPGEVYRVSGITFAGAPLLSAEAFGETAKLHAGDIASRKALLDTLAPLDAAYRRQGYMDMTIVAKPTLDAAAHTVAYDVTFSPGEQYRIKDLTVNNLDATAQASFDRAFSMKAGELYNPDYVANFLGQKKTLAAIAGYTGNYTAYAHPVTHTVDLVISYVRMAR